MPAIFLQFTITSFLSIAFRRRKWFLIVISIHILNVFYVLQIIFIIMVDFIINFKRIFLLCFILIVEALRIRIWCKIISLVKLGHSLHRQPLLIFLFKFSRSHDQWIIWVKTWCIRFVFIEHTFLSIFFLFNLFNQFKCFCYCFGLLRGLFLLHCLPYSVCTKMLYFYFLLVFWIIYFTLLFFFVIMSSFFLISVIF